MDNNRKGDYAEHRAVLWLWEQGFEVFKNCGCTGPIDLVAVDKDGNVILIDVKTLLHQLHMEDAKGDPDYARRPGGNGLTDLQKQLGVQVLGYNRERDELVFTRHPHETTYSRYRDKQHPQLDLGMCDSGC